MMMGPRYCFEILDGSAMYDCFAYFDTHDHVADFLFEQEHVSVTIEGEYAADDDPYRIVLARIAREDRESFLEAVDLLPSLMAYIGKTDYEDFCRDVMLDARNYLGRRRNAGVCGRLQ